MKPQYSFFMLVGIGIVLFLLYLFFPNQGVPISSDLTLRFPLFSDISSDLKKTDSLDIKEFVNVEELLAIYTLPIDSLAIKDSISEAKLKEIKRRQDLLDIQYKDGVIQLDKFFLALENVQETPVRVFHFGDSQIEGDRMTGYLRNEFQKKYGGIGCGLLPLFETFPTFAIKQKDSGNWKRHAVFFNKNKKSTHKRYGILANYSRFTPVIEDSLLNDSVSTKSWVSFSTNSKTYNRSGKYHNATLLYGYNNRDVVVKVFKDEKEVSIDTLKANNTPQEIEWKFLTSPESLSLEFEGVDSPDIYGISLDNSQGVHIDNIPMRGSSGTVFTKIDKELFRTQIENFNVSLILLQYGGNTVPSIKSKKQVDDYGRWFQSQIKYLQRAVPNASIIVIGPSDMTEIVDGVYQTRAFLEDVRDALKLAAFNTDCGFWDLYEVMGGKNSMISWVEADPPLAANDYTHFAPGGAKKITKLFYKALMNDYETLKKGNLKLDTP